MLIIWTRFYIFFSTMESGLVYVLGSLFVSIMIIWFLVLFFSLASPNCLRENFKYSFMSLYRYSGMVEVIEFCV